MSSVLKSRSTKPFVSCCKKTSNCSIMAFRSSDSGFSFLARAKTYFASAAGSASHLLIKCFGKIREKCYQRNITYRGAKTVVSQAFNASGLSMIIFIELKNSRK